MKIFLLLLVAAVSAYDSFVATVPTNIETNQISGPAVGRDARCLDPDLAQYINIAKASFIDNMNDLSKSVVNQIIAAHKTGYWIVHAQMIQKSQQGNEWQTTTNSQLFTSGELNGCVYIDMETYILVLRVI